MKKTYRIEGLDCANCAAKIEGMISKLDGVNSCTINFITGKIIIDADDEIAAENDSAAADRA